jgi:N-acetylneuraminic acid mutarotase
VNLHPRVWLASAALLAGGLVRGHAQNQGWTTLAPLDEPRQEIGVAALDGNVYAVGGFREDRTTTATAEVYDPRTDSWTTVQPLPVAVNHPAAAANGGKLYVLGGYRGPGLRNATDALQVYDPAAQTWTLKASMPSARGGLAAVAIGGKVYAVGGAAEAAVGDAAAYDPATDSWTTLEPLPTPRDHLGAGVVDGKLFAVGGRDGSSFTLTTVEVYDPATNRWQQLPPLPTGRSGHGVAVLGGCLYAFGGEGNGQDLTGVFAEVEGFNAARVTWTSLAPMPTPRHGMGAAAVADRIFLPGGATVAGFGATDTHEAFTAPGCG